MRIFHRHSHLLSLTKGRPKAWADAVAAALAAANCRKADLVAAVDEVRCPFGNVAVSGLLTFVWWNLCEIVCRFEMP